MNEAGPPRCWSPWELVWAAAWSTALAVLTCLPYLFGDMQAAEHGGQYLGFVFNPDEPNVHLSWIEQARAGQTFFHNAFTSEAHEGRFFNLFMLVCGRFAAATGLSSYQVWALARVLAVVLLGVGCYVAIAHITSRRRLRWLALATVTLSSGLGWYALGGAPWPALEALPLVSMSLLVLGLASLERALRDGSARHAVAGLVCGALLHGVPRADGLLLVAFAGVYLTALRALAPDADLGSEAWRRRWVWLALLLLVTRPVLRYETPLPGPAWLLLVVAALAYYLLLTSAGQQPAARIRFAAVALAAVIAWAATGPQLGLDPVDSEPNLVMPEAITFLSLYLNPLFTTSMALLVLAMINGQLALREQRPWSAVAAGAWGLLLANVHTYDAVPLLLALGVYLVVLMLHERRWVAGAASAYLAIVVLVAPGVMYQSHLIAADPLYRAKAMTQTLTPGLPSMLVSYGWLVPLAIAGGLELVARRGVAGAFWPTWAVVHGACIFLPASVFPFQRKMAEGLHIPLALLAAYALLSLARRVGAALGGWATAARYRQAGPTWSVRCDHACRRQSLVPWLALTGVIVLLPSNLLFVSSTLAALQNNNAAKWSKAMPPFWVPTAESEALDWLAANLPPDAVIGCLPYIGSYIPGRCGRTVYCGHWAETIEFGRKLGALSDFYRAPGPAATKVAFLREAGITHLYYGAWELAHVEQQLPQIPALEMIYPPHGAGEGTPAVVIYRVRGPSEPLPVPEAVKPAEPTELAAPAPASDAP